MFETLGRNLLERYIGEQTMPDVIRQLLVIAACFVMGWIVSRAVGTYWVRLLQQLPEERRRRMQMSALNIARVLMPCVMLVMLLASEGIMRKMGLPKTMWAIAIPLVISQILIRFVFYVSRRIFPKESVAGELLRQFHKLFSSLVWLWVVLYILGVWQELTGLLEDITISLGRNEVSLLTICQATISVLVTLLMALWVSAVIEDRIMGMHGMHSSLRTAVARMSKALLVLVAILVSLTMVGIDLTVLSVFGGALGVGLGLGLQKIASSYVSGFMILLERTLSIGDMVNVDQYFGKVTKIKARYTVLEGLDGIESILPNEIFISSPVQNYSLSHRVIRLSTQFTVLYQENIDVLLLKLAEAALTVERVARQVMPQAYLIKIGQDGLDIEVGFWITDPENGRLNVLSDVNRAIWKLLQAEGIRVAHPKREVRLMHERSFEQQFTNNDTE